MGKESQGVINKVINIFFIALGEFRWIAYLQ